MVKNTKFYGQFTGRYGEQVQVYYSSGMSYPQCWLMVDTAANKNDGLGGERVEATALLTVPMARLLIAALENFIDQENEEAQQ